MSKATESCSCGSSFTYEGGVMDLADRFAEWRASHRHDPSPTPPADPAAASDPDVRAVTGTHHQAGPVRSGPVGRRYVGFELNPTPEKEIH